MTCIYSNRYRFTFAISMMMLIIAGCGSSDPSTIPIDELVFGPGDFKLVDTTAGLAALSSYRATLTYTFDGTLDGHPERWSKTYIMLTTRESEARILTIETSGNTVEAGNVFMAEASGASYERLEDQFCTARATQSENLLGSWLEPAGFLNSVIGAEHAGSEEINGVSAEKYTFDERALGATGITESIGEMWMATEGGYLLKYQLSSQGNAAYFGEGIEGAVTWDYELTEINQSLTMEIPTDCPAGMVDAPLLPDASNVLNVPSVLSYDTSTSLEEAAAFYDEQIPTLGWEPVGEPAISEETSLLTFEKGDMVMKVILSSTTGTIKVSITVNRIQP